MVVKRILDLICLGVNEFIWCEGVAEITGCMIVPESWADNGKENITRRQKLKNDVNVQECDANEARLCTNVWFIKNKFKPICYNINETIIFEDVNK